MDYPEVDFELDTVHFTVAHKPSGAIFRFDGYPDPVNGNEVQVTVQDDIDDDELNDVLWAAIKGPNAPPPLPVRSRFSR